MLHSASHRSVRDLVVDGGAAGALRPIAPLLVPLRMARWGDTLPTARDLEAAVRAAEADTARAARAVAAIAAPPPPPTGVDDLARMGLIAEWQQNAPPVAPPAPARSSSYESNKSGASGGRRISRASNERGLVTAGGGGAEGEQAAGRASRVVPLNAFCFSGEVRPGAGALNRARARLALPGSDVSKEEDAAQREALRRALAAQRRMATRLPLWFVHGEGGRCGEGMGAVARELDMPAFALELGAEVGGEGAEPKTLQELATR